ncbi:unnamed protein product [Cylindrotheca closterium]|uniref:Calmodulin n=1 Tax=Cylindrotheca closterium TaxID=2856 RepID=A0AAD2G9A0_9STRA|nr:unnamed protein product [Cylindrotheca closterium]
MDMEQALEVFVYDGKAAVPKEATSVKIDSSVIEIPYGAFKDCKKIEKVDFSKADSLKVIGEDSFYYCSALKGAKFPKNLEVISKEAFNGCSKLVDIDFSEAESLLSIGYHAFFKCTSVKKVSFPKKLTSVATRAFRYCGFTHVDMSQAVGLERIEDSTFSRCTDLKEIKLPPYLKVVSKTAFQHCGFEEIDFGGDLSLAKIEEEAFMNCEKLKSVKLSPNLQLVAKTAFKNCHALESIDFGQTSVLQVLEEECLSRCSALRKVTLPQHLVVIGKRTFEYSGMRELDFTSATRLEMISEESFLCCSSLYKVVFPLNLKLLAKGAFQRCAKLSEIDFSLATKLAGIGEGAFSHSYALRTVKLSSNLRTIEQGAFEGCAKLAEIDFLESINLQAISKSGFYRCESLTRVAFPSNLWVIGKRAFEGCSGLESIDFSNANVLQRVGDYSFAGCVALEEVKFPQSLNLISEGAFQRCEALEITDFSNAEALERIGAYAFGYCSSLDEVTFPFSLKVCEQKAYLQCGNLSCVKLGAPLERIGEMAFYGCESLREIDVMSTPDIGEDAFNFSGTFVYSENGKCPNDLIHLRVNPEVKVIEDRGAQGRKTLRDIDFSAAFRLFRIGISSFDACESLRTVGFPSSVKEIAQCAFRGCIHLEDVDFTQALSLEIIKEKAFFGCKSLRVVRFPSNLIVIGDGAYKFCNLLNEVDFGATRTLETIGNGSFSGCESLSTIVVPGTITFFGDEVFGDNPSLKSIDVDGQNLALSIRIHLLYRTQSEGTITKESLIYLYSIGPIKERELLTNQESERSKLRETKSAYIQSVISSFCSEEFSVRRQHGWVQFLAHHLEDETDDFRSLIDFFHKADLETLRVLANSKDRDGRVALKFATSSIRETFEERLLFLGRYDLAQGPPIHKSSTCLVLKAEDYKMHQYYGSIFDKHGTHATSMLRIEGFFAAIRDLMLVSREDVNQDGLRMAATYFARADIDKTGAIDRNEFIAFCQEQLGRNVALKFMRKDDQFQRELEGRIDLDNKYVVNILRAHDRSEVPEDSISGFIGDYLVLDESVGGSDVHDARDYSCIVVMPYGDRNLDTIFRSERPDTVTIRKLMKEVGEGLEHLHTKRLVHGDLKMSNILRMNYRLCLIDLDSSARIDGDFVGAKFSSGVLPPELIYRLQSFDEKEMFVKYFEKESSAERQKRQPQFTTTRPFQGFVVRTFLQMEDIKEEQNLITGKMEKIWNAEPLKEGLPYDLVMADPSLDVWSFGVLLYMMCAGQSLFTTDRDDDITDGNTFLFLHAWEETDLKKVVASNVRDNLAKDLLSQLLRKNPSERPTMKEVLMHEFFHPDRHKATSAEKSNGDYTEEFRLLLKETSDKMSLVHTSLEDISGKVEDVRSTQAVQLDGLEAAAMELAEQGEQTRTIVEKEFKSVKVEIERTHVGQAKAATMAKNILKVQGVQVSETVKLQGHFNNYEEETTRLTTRINGKFETGKSLKLFIEKKSYPRCFILLSKDGLFDPRQYSQTDGLLCCLCPLTMKLPRSNGKVMGYKVHFNGEFIRHLGPILLLSLAILQAECSAYGADFDFPLREDLLPQAAFDEARFFLIASMGESDGFEILEDYRERIKKCYDSIGIYLNDKRFAHSGLEIAACMGDGTFELLHPEVVSVYQQYGRSCFGMTRADIRCKIGEKESETVHC